MPLNSTGRKKKLTSNHIDHAMEQSKSVPKMKSTKLAPKFKKSVRRSSN